MKFINKKDPGSERRQYIRLDSVYPVQFRLLSPDGKRFMSEWLQGFTNNLSRGGICLLVNHLNRDVANLIKLKQVIISLDIEMPVTKGPISALAKVAWVKDDPIEPNKYQIGLSYQEIDNKLKGRIMFYTWTKKLFVPAIAVLIIILGVGVGINSYLNIRLAQGNKALIDKLVKVMQESNIARQKISDIDRDREDLKSKINALSQRIKELDQEKIASKEESKKIKELSSMMESLSHEKKVLQERLDSLQGKEGAVTDELFRLDKKKAALQKANLEKMYKWLAVHQNPRTGLVMSFEGDSDIAGWAFIYDQSLAAQAYVLFGDFTRAKKLLDFFDKKAKRIDGRFVNAYYVNDGAPAEFTVHAGPNLWLGIAVLQYTQKTGDKDYLNMAEEIGRATIDLQNDDPQGGIRGGPGIDWYSTEHNLDAYAFFNMMYKITGDVIYQSARDKVLNWIVLHTYDSNDIPIKRGKGDATIATDTYAWSIASIGPEKLEELKLDPDKIIEFAEANCAVEVNYVRPDGEMLKIRGFDFAAKKHLARGGVVSPEWTSQMVISFKLMADFNYKKGVTAKAKIYEQKAQDYLAQLANMIICSPSPSGQGDSCLPYASQETVDTGHGWITPKGKSTGSIAGTAYTLFAYYSYNPLELRD